MRKGNPGLLPGGCRETDRAVSSGKNLDLSLVLGFYQVLINRKKLYPLPSWSGVRSRH